jgi:hypothetical protein
MPALQDPFADLVPSGPPPDPFADLVPPDAAPEAGSKPVPSDPPAAAADPRAVVPAPARQFTYEPLPDAMLGLKDAKTGIPLVRETKPGKFIADVAGEDDGGLYFADPATGTMRRQGPEHLIVPEGGKFKVYERREEVRPWTPLDMGIVQGAIGGVTAPRDVLAGNVAPGDVIRRALETAMFGVTGGPPRGPGANIGGRPPPETPPPAPDIPPPAAAPGPNATPREGVETAGHNPMMPGAAATGDVPLSARHAARRVCRAGRGGGARAVPRRLPQCCAPATPAEPDAADRASRLRGGQGRRRRRRDAGGARRHG